MVMSEQSSDGKRDGARIFGVIFQLLAVVSIVATIYALERIASLGNAFGVSNTNDPLIWIVLASGIFVTSVFIGMGYALGLLSAIYDRQEPNESSGETSPTKLRATHSTDVAPNHPSPMTLVIEDHPVLTDPFENSTPPLAESSITSSTQEVTETSSLREWLTRERHFKRGE